MGSSKTIVQIEQEFLDSGWEKAKLADGTVLTRPLTIIQKRTSTKNTNGSSTTIEKIRNRIAEVVWGY